MRHNVCFCLNADATLNCFANWWTRVDSKRSLDFLRPRDFLNGPPAFTFDINIFDSKSAKRKIMRLTREKILEIQQIRERWCSLGREYVGEHIPLREDRIRRELLKLRHGGELESYKIKLENFILDTDVKGKAKREFITCQ